MKQSIGTLSFGRNRSILKPTKHVTLDRVETIDNQFREYGFLKTNQLSTPFPLKNKPIDLASLKARLEAEKIHLKSAKSLSDIDRNVRFTKELSTTVTQRASSFAKQRKLFDEGEFLICKGRKITDGFHPSSPKGGGHSYRLTRVPSSETLYFEEVTKFCLEYNIQLTKGAVDMPF